MPQLTLRQYTQPDCGTCRAGLMILKSMNIKVELVDVTQDPVARQFMDDNRYTGTPSYAVVNSDGQVVIDLPNSDLQAHWYGNRIDLIKKWAEHLTPARKVQKAA